jgi:multiple sugar transport system substrate-binding protein
MLNPVIKGKKGVFALGSLACVAALVACSNATSSGNTSSQSFGSSSAESSASQNYVAYDPSVYGDPTALSADITFWTTTGHQNQDALSAITQAFNQVYPNINVNILAQGAYSDIQTKINDAIPSGTTPTIAYCYPDHVANYLAAGAVMDIQNFVNDPTIGFLAANEASEGHHSENGMDVYGTDDYVKAYWDEGTAYQLPGLYSVPFTKSTEALYYNKTIFDEMGWSVPETWDDLWSLCDTIKGQNPDYVPFGYDSDSNLFISALASNGIPYTSSTGAHYLFNNAAAKTLVQNWVSKVNAGEFETQGTLPNSSYTSTDFIQQKTLMIVSSTGGASYADTDNFDVGVAPLPIYAGHELQVISQGPSICFFQRGSWAQKYAAWLFYKFCTSAEWSARFAVASTGYNPVRVSSYDTDYYTGYLAESADTIYGRTATVTEAFQDNMFYSPVFVGSSAARDAVGKILTLVVQTNLTVDEAFQQVYDECVAG